MAAPPIDLRQLFPVGARLTTEEATSGLNLASLAPSERPYVVLNMVATADGRATLEGRTIGMGGPADREIFHGLRTQVDAVLFGAGTARIERYGRMIRDEAGRARRRIEGLEADPLACVVSGRLDLPVDLPLLRDPESRVLVITSSEVEVEGAAARMDYLRPSSGLEYLEPSARGSLELSGTLERLRAEHGVRTLLCEGGPHLNRALLREGLVDELFLSLVPTLTGDSEAATILAGPAFGAPVGMELVRLLEHRGYLFLRYRLGRLG